MNNTPEELQPLVRSLVWRENPAPPVGADAPYLHIGCGNNPFEGFVNIDFLPESPEILQWDLLDIWPESLAGKVAHAFSEDVLEHFFFEEQVYILAQMNLALQERGVFRVLMPNLDSLLRSGEDFKRGEGYLAEYFGVETRADVVNLGMRFGGHRWLHDQESMAFLAELCGFEAKPTPCQSSMIPELSGLNLRDETNSLSFAHDLQKHAPLRRLVLQPTEVVGAERRDDLAPGQPLYRSTIDDPQVSYVLPTTISSHDIVLLVFRGANLSQFREHNYSEAFLVEKPGHSLPLDRSMSSSFHTSMIAAPLIQARSGRVETSRVRFDPSSRAGDVFSLGPLEVYLR